MNKRKAIKKIKENDFFYLEKLFHRWSPNWDNYNQNLGSIINNLKQAGRVEAALGYYLALKNTDSDKAKLYKQLPQAPILVLVGEKDGTVDLSHFNKMHTASVTFFKVEKHRTAGHFLHQEDELFCLTHILDFF